jgi:signal transduction histidine kinase
VKKIYAGFFCAFACLAGCVYDGAIDGGYPSISTISLSWMELKSDVIKTGLFGIEDGDFEGPIKDFRLDLGRFSSSQIGFFYKIYRPDCTQLLEGIDSAAERLNAIFKESGGGEIFPIILEIDSSIEKLQLIEKSLSDTSQWNYFFLFFSFTLLIIIIIIAFWLLYGRLEKVESRERQSLAFSRETLLAQEQERSRIARELHDTVAQDLWRLSFQTESIDKAMESGERSMRCKEVVKGQKELMRRVRSICDSLIPPDFQLRRFGDALRNLCYNFEQRSGIECNLVIKDKPLPVGMNGDIQLQCYRIVQECLANIEKHAEATEVSVACYNNEKCVLVISVSDNCRGFSPPDRDSCRSLRAAGHYGLWSIYERAASISSVVTLDSFEGEGTMVTLQVPLGNNSLDLANSEGK